MEARLAQAASFVLGLLACSDALGNGYVDIDALPKLTYTEEIRIGSLDDPVAGFSAIGGVAVAPNGEIFVLETQEREVRVYDASGARIRTIRRQGQGPGEFERPLFFGMLHDTLWVSDLGNRRISWFTADGTLLFETRMTVRVPIEGGEALLVGLSPGQPTADGFISSAFSFAPRAGALPLPDSLMIPNIRFDRTGAVHDTSGWRVQRELPFRVVDVERSAFTLSTGLLAPTNEQDTFTVAWDVPPEAERGFLTLTRRLASGDTIFHRVLEYPAAPIPGSFTDSIVDSHADRLAPRGIDRASVEKGVREALSDLPPHYPPISVVHRGADGGVWLRRLDAAPAAAADSRATWVLVDPAGDVRGVLDLPSSMTLRYCDADTAWLVDRDAFGVPWLVKIGIGR